MSDLGRVVRSYLASRKRSGGAVAKAGGGAFGVYSPAEQAELDDVAPMKIERTPDETPVQFKTASPLVNITEGDIDRGIEVGLGAATIGDAGGAGPVRRGLRPKPLEGYNPVHEPAPAAPAEAVPLDRPGVDGTPGGGAGVRTPELQAERRAAGRPVLPGLPTGRQQVSGEDFIPGPYGQAHDVAERYMASREGAPSLHYRAPEKYHEIDPEHSAAIAQAFEEMKHAPNDPAVKASYDELIKETLAQYQAIKESGLKITPVNAADYPYHGNPRAVAKDVADNNHMAFFKTDEGFGVGDAIHRDNPMLLPSGEKIGEHNMLNNDIFRVVHDYFGHIKNGYGFRATGEDNAWRAHAAMYSDLARPAMTTETRGQNSWVNYGPHGEKNRTASGADTVYADQKVGLMPDWTMYDKGKAPPMMYHGSAAEYLRPDLSRLGSGQGEMAYGAGYYGSQGERVGQRYRDMQAPKQWTLNGQPASLLHAYENMRDSLMITGTSAGRAEHVADAIGQLMEHGYSAAKIKNMVDREGLEKEFATALKVASRYKNTESPGHLYKWAIEADPEHLLNWDTTFGKQTPHVQERVEGDMRQSVEGQRSALQGAIDKIRRGDGNYRRDDVGTRRAMRDLEDYEKRLATLTLQGLTGREVYRRMGLPAKDQTEAYVRASHQLKDKGIPGLRYKNISGGADSGVSNYVMFDPDKLRLLRRYADGGEVDGDVIPEVDPEKFNKPTGEMRASTFKPTERIGNAVSTALQALGMKPYTANDLTKRVGNVVSASPLGIAGSALDAIDARRRGDDLGTVEAMAGMVPGVRPAARTASELVLPTIRRARGVHLPPEENPGLMPQLAERYPETAPPVPKIDKVTGRPYLGKDLSDEALELKKHRLAMKPDIEAGNYQPYFDPAKRADVDPSKYPAMTDTGQLLMKKPVTRAQYDLMAGNPEAVGRLDEAYARGLMQKDAAGNWYFMKQLEQEFVKEYGAKEGRQKFKERFADAMAATTGGADPTGNLLMAHYGNYLKEKGLSVPPSNQLPYPVGGQYAARNMDQFRKMIMEGQGIDELNPKRYNFSGNFLGQRMRSTIDEQMSRLFKPGMEKPPDGSYGHFENVLAARAAHHGVDPRYFQEVAWAGAKDAAEKGGYAAKPMISHVNDAIERTHRITGMSPSEIVRRALVRAEIPLYGGAAAAALPALRDKEEGEGFAEGGAAGDDYNTATPDEAAFQGWRAVNAPLDSGVDYDLRGAYLAGVQRDENGHMTDRFKKPNHPTFSDQSQYATGDQRARAGHWVGDTFVPPSYAEGGDVDQEQPAPAFDPQKFAAVKAATPAATTAAMPVFDPAKFKAVKEAAPMSASDVLSGVIENAPSSAWQFAQDVVRPITHPIETAKGIKDLTLGLLEKSGAVGTIFPGAGGGHEQYADAMGQYLKSRYGSLENIKRSIAKDPVGILADASMVLTGGGSAAARLPGVMGKTGEIIGNVGRAVDPLMAPINAAKVGTKAVGELLTHTGAPALENAYRTGVQGGEAGDVFRDNMRGHVGVSDVVETARQGVSNIAKQRSQDYVRDMAAIGKRPEIMDWDKVTQAIDKNATVKKFEGIDISPETAATRNKIRDAIYKWGELPPETYHTAAGFDALKQMIGEMRDAETYGTPGRNVADRAYHAVRDEIVKQVPEYGKAMKNYEQASNLIKEMNQTLSLNPRGNIDTALRKLQSIMRNNVNTNYGRRLELGQMLEANGATHLMSALSGQSLNAWAPRGLGKFVAGSTLPAIGAGLASGHILPAIGAGAVLPFMSPRAMGEVAHFAGRTAGRALERTNKAFSSVGLGNNRAAGNVAYRLGRATNPNENDNPYAP